MNCRVHIYYTENVLIEKSCPIPELDLTNSFFSFWFTVLKIDVSFYGDRTWITLKWKISRQRSVFYTKKKTKLNPVSWSQFVFIHTTIIIS